jgi:cell division protein FtsI/penicillin-binding protein 2
MNAELRRARHRQMFIFLFVLLGMGALIARLYYWQVWDGPNLAQAANEEHTQSQIVNAPRGLIYDSEGHLLATNVIRDDVYIEPIQFNADNTDTSVAQAKLAVIVQTLHSILGIAAAKLYSAFNSGLATYRVATDISPAQSQALVASHLSYIFLAPHPVRVYPGGDLAAQVLGYVAPDPNNPNGYSGSWGIEGLYNTLLAGKPGSMTAETDLNGNPLTVGAGSNLPPVSGANLTLTIDSTIQYDAQLGLANTVKQSEAQSGSVIVLNARTGAVVAMAGYPTFDPNQYARYANVMGCLGQESVYFNPALYCGYEPGSTMKAVTMAAALDLGLITPDTAIYDPGYINLGDNIPTVTNWQYEAWGHETMTQVLEHSANVGAAYVGYKILGPDRFYEYVQRFGFGQQYNLTLPSQEALSTYRSNTADPKTWSPSDLARQSFGQSIYTTPFQMAMVYQTIANGGVMMQPYLVSSINNNGHVTTIQPQVERRVIAPRTAQLLTYMLEQVPLHGIDTPVEIPGYDIAAKTGTATTQGLAEDQTEASVAGFLPGANPQFVILVKIDRPQATIYGITAAGPLWKSIAQDLIWHYALPPDMPQQ